MIHAFSVSNYYSVREEVVLDLRIPGTAPDLPRFRRSTAKPDIRLPSVVVFMGPEWIGQDDPAGCAARYLPHRLIRISC